MYLLPRTCFQTSLSNVIMAASRTPRRSSLSGFQRRSYKPATPRWVRSDLVLGGTPALPGIQFRTQNLCDAPAAPVEGRNWSGELADPVVRPRFFRVDAESTKECPVMSFGNHAMVVTIRPAKPRGHHPPLRRSHGARIVLFWVSGILENSQRLPPTWRIRNHIH